jgi:HEPN domain-containing protein
MATAKLEDAKLLFESGRYANAFYLCGYSVEFALKSCIARRIAVDAIPDK